MKIGDQVDITKFGGICVFCEKVIIVTGMSVAYIKGEILKHIKSCPKHPLRGFNARKYDDDIRGPDEGMADYRME